MLSFKANVKVLQREPDMPNIKIDRYEYEFYRVEVADLEMLAIFDIKRPVEEGAYVEGNSVQLISCVTPSKQTALVLRVAHYEVVTEEAFVPEDYLTVLVNGKLLKAKNAPLKYVGKKKTPFLPCTIRVCQDSAKNYCSMFVVAFSEIAEELHALPEETFIDIEARVRPQLYNPGLELNVTSFKVIK